MRLTVLGACGAWPASGQACSGFLVGHAGFRLEAGGRVLAYTGDSGPDPEVVRLARDASGFLAEASFTGRIPSGARGLLSSAAEAGRQARQAGVGRLILTHLSPRDGPGHRCRGSAASYDGPIDIATAGLHHRSGEAVS